MGFDNVYYREIKKDSNNYKGANSTILPFWGFTYDTYSDSYVHTINVRDSTTKSGWSKASGIEYKKGERFVRKGSAGYEESRFTALVHKNDKDIWDTPYIPLSVREYYERCITSPAGWIGAIGGCLGIIAAVLWLLLCDVFTRQLLMSWMGDSEWFDVVFVFVCPVAICLAIWIFTIILAIIARTITGSEKTYVELSTEEKEIYREKYLASMVKKYGKKAGAILQEYAKLKGYDKI